MKLPALLLPFLAACAVASDGSPTTDADMPPERSLEGEYVVTFVNGKAPLIDIEGYEPTVTISSGRIHFQSQCIYEDWSYDRDGESVTTGPWDYGDQLVGMCARGLAPGETAIIRALEGADTVRFIPRGVWFSGDGGTAQMQFRPSKEDLAGRAVDLTGEWRVGAIDGKAMDAAHGLALSADFYGIWWEPGCAGQGVSYTIAGNSFDVPEPGNPGEVCDIDFPSELTAVWAALAEADTIERTAENGIRIHGKGRSVTLFSQ